MATDREAPRRVAISSDNDIVNARAQARDMSISLGFSSTDATLVATAISEVARNLVVHAGGGELAMTAVSDGGLKVGLTVEATDSGPGIRDVEAALGSRYTGRGGLGLGLPGARRLMDEFSVESSAESGTVVRMTKWRIVDELEQLRRRRAGDDLAGGDGNGAP
jgi:serine/threonine-protein kinase RsbT